MPVRRTMLRKAHCDRIRTDYGIVNGDAQARKLLQLSGCGRQINTIASAQQKAPNAEAVIWLHNRLDRSQIVGGEKIDSKTAQQLG